MKRARRLWPLFYAVLALGMVSPALVPGKTLSGSDLAWNYVPWQAERPDGVPVIGTNFELADSTVQFQPWLQYNRSQLPGRIPLWNPYIMGGRPYLANSQSAMFSPFSLPAYVLGFWSSLALIAALKVFVSAVGMFLLARTLGMRFAGAFLAGLVVSLNLGMVENLSWPHSSVWALLPWLLLLTARLVDRPDPLHVAGLAGVVALQFFAGHPESSFNALFGTAAFFVWYALVRRPRPAWREQGRIALTFAAALAGGAALAAVVLVPFLELVRESNEFSLRIQHDAHLSRSDLRLLFLPGFEGRPTQIQVGPTFSYARVVYVGALPLMLAVAAVVSGLRWSRIAIAGFVLVCGAVAYGAAPFFDVVTRLPLFEANDLRRITTLAVFGVALLAGWGMDDVMERRRGASRALLVAVPLLLFPIFLVHFWAAGDLWRPAVKAALGLAAPPGPPFDTADITHLGSLLVWLGAGGIAVALLVARTRGWMTPAVFAALALGLVVADLFRAGVGYNPAIAKADAVQPATGSIRYLQGRRPARFAGVGATTLHPDLAIRYRLYDARGYDFPVDERFRLLWDGHAAFAHPEIQGRRVIPTEVTTAPPSAGDPAASWLRVLNLLSVSDIVQPRADPPLRKAGLTLAYDGPDARVYANSRALPRAFVVAATDVVEGEDAARRAVLAPGFDGRRRAVVERPIPGLSEGTAALSAPATITGYEPERVTVRASADRRGLLVLTDLHYPGWTATVDGRSAPIERVDYLLRGVALQPGNHTVEFRYRPASWRAGWIVSLVALVGLAAAALVGLRARRRLSS